MRLGSSVPVSNALKLSISVCDDDIILEGQKMSKLKFVNKHCMGEHHNEICERVARSSRKDSTFGPMIELCGKTFK